MIPETVKETVARVVRERAQRDAYALACVRKALEAAAKEADANPGRCYTEHPNELGTRVRISERIRALRAEDFVGDDS